MSCPTFFQNRKIIMQKLLHSDFLKNMGKLPSLFFTWKKFWLDFNLPWRPPVVVYHLWKTQLNFLKTSIPSHCNCRALVLTQKQFWFGDAQGTSQACITGLVEDVDSRHNWRKLLRNSRSWTVFVTIPPLFHNIRVITLRSTQFFRL